jgi:hypothetical protein
LGGEAELDEIEVTVEELLAGLKRRNLPLPFEIGAFIALEACEQMLDRPVRLDARDVGIGDIGEVVCSVKKSPVSEESAVRALLLLLSELLMCSAPGVPQMLLELVERGPSNGKWSLERLRDDLEACLVPLNRGATRRVLSRFTREARKAGVERERSRERTGPPSVVPAASEIDAQFDALMAAGDKASPLAAAAPAAPAPAAQLSRAPSSAVASAFAAPTSVARSPAPIASPLPRGSFAREDDAPTLEFGTSRASRSPGAQAASLRALRSAAASQEPTPPTAASARTPARRITPSEVELIEPGELGRAPVSSRAHRAERDYDAIPEREERSVSPHPAAPVDDLLADMPDRERPRAPALIGWALAVAAVALAGAYLVLGQAGARRVLGLVPVAEAPLPEPPSASAPARAAGELRVTSQPGRAQVFLFVGNGPATATDLPIGVAQEFVAMAEGHAPTRAVVPADAQWEEVSGGQQPRYELAMQAGKLDRAERALELGTTLLPRDVGSPTGRLGTARVITTPKAAKVYLLIGFTPDVRVENLPLDAGYEVLVYLPGHGMQTRRVEPSDFKEQDGKRIAELDLPLTAARARRP